MGASIPSKQPEDSQAALTSKLELVKPIVQQLVIEGSLSSDYSYEQFCEDLDLEDIYSRRLVELLVKETFNRRHEGMQSSGSSLPSSSSSDQVYITSGPSDGTADTVPSGAGSSKWFYQTNPRDGYRRGSSVSDDSLAGMDIQELDGLRVVDSWDQDR